MIFFFFFQAEDGIRDTSVTGVQTCALPISSVWIRRSSTSCGRSPSYVIAPSKRSLRVSYDGSSLCRSEERRVGKECRSRWSREHEKENRDVDDGRVERKS